MVISEKPFISNCLFQALKHKLKNWNEVKIKIIFHWAKYKPHLHFYWQDKLYDYHFASCKKWKGKPVFKGDIHRHPKNSLKKIYIKMLKR